MFKLCEETLPDRRKTVTCRLAGLPPALLAVDGVATMIRYSHDLITPHIDPYFYEVLSSRDIASALSSIERSPFFLDMH